VYTCAVQWAFTC